MERHAEGPTLDWGSERLRTSQAGGETRKKCFRQKKQHVQRPGGSHELVKVKEVEERP